MNIKYHEELQPFEVTFINHSPVNTYIGMGNKSSPNTSFFCNYWSNNVFWVSYGPKIFIANNMDDIATLAVPG